MAGRRANGASALSCCASFAATWASARRAAGVWTFSIAPRYAPRLSVASVQPSFTIESREPKLPRGYEKSMSAAVVGACAAPVSNEASPV